MAKRHRRKIQKRIDAHLEMMRDLYEDAIEAFCEGRSGQCIVFANRADRYQKRAARLALRLPIRQKLRRIERLIHWTPNQEIFMWACALRNKALRLYQEGSLEAALQILGSHPRPLST